MLPPLHIIVDTREQNPWAWDQSDATVEVAGLEVGDYALAQDTQIPKRNRSLRPVRYPMERKNLDDFLKSISTGWETGSIRKIMNYPLGWKPLIGEFDLADLCFRQVGNDVLPPEHNHPNLRPAFVMRRIAELGEYGVAVLMAGDATKAAGLAYRIFRRRQDMEMEGVK